MKHFDGGDSINAHSGGMLEDSSNEVAVGELNNNDDSGQIKGLSRTKNSI